MRRSYELATFVLLAGCGEPTGGDIAGTYRADDYLTATCDLEPRPQALMLYVQLTARDGGFDSDAFGEPTLQTKLVGSLFDRIFYDAPITGGWAGSYATAGIGSESPSCSLLYAESTAVGTATGLAIELRHYGISGVTPCTEAEARARGDSMPCIVHTRFDATKL